MDANKMQEEKNILLEAKQAESSQQFAIAEELYRQLLHEDSLNEYAYNRLMIIFRKQKDKKNELKIIDTAISAYQKFQKTNQQTTKKITAISNKLNKAFGLTDKKGNTLYPLEPIATWQKRKALLEHRKPKKK